MDIEACDFSSAGRPFHSFTNLTNNEVLIKNSLVYASRDIWSYGTYNTYIDVHRYKSNLRFE